MNFRRPILALLALFSLAASGPAAPDPGPENEGLQLSLELLPRSQTGKDGFDIHLDLINTTRGEITLTGFWSLIISEVSPDSSTGRLKPLPGVGLSSTDTNPRFPERHMNATLILKK